MSNEASTSADIANANSNHTSHLTDGEIGSNGAITKRNSSGAKSSDKKPTVKFSLHENRSASVEDSARSPLSTPTASNVQSYDSPATSNALNRSPLRSSMKKVGGDDIANTFMRTDSIIIRVKPGQTFTEYAPIVVEPVAKNDPRLGTLGELRHHLRTGTSNQVKKFLRHNHWTSGHRIRAELWKELCRDSNADGQRALYKETVAKLHRGQSSKPVMLDSPNIVQYDHQLRENGKIVLMRLLTVIEHVRPDFTFIPILYPLVALFLHYMVEEDVFACIMKLLSHSQKFLIQTDIAVSASKRTLLVLVKKHVHRAYVLFKKLTTAQDDKDLIPIFDDWKCWVFRDLPFSHLVRVVDCFLYEGQKVIFRIALALIQLWLKESCTCVGGVLNIKPPRKKPTIDCVLESGLTDVVSAQNLKSLLAPHRFLDANFVSKILSEAQSVEIVKMIPPRFQLKAMVRLFNLDEDGTSFTRLWQKIDDYAPTILVLKTSKNEIFGAFCSEAWGCRRRTTRLTYFGTGESFLFKFSPDPIKYVWVGIKKSAVEHKEELFQSADGMTLFIGGGGLTLQNSLEKGSSEYCATFDNPPLSSSTEFSIEAMEVFGFIDDEP